MRGNEGRSGEKNLRTRLRRMRRTEVGPVAEMINKNRGAGVPEWEEYPHTPAVFARVANTGDKSEQRTGIAVRPGRTIAERMWS